MSQTAINLYNDKHNCLAKIDLIGKWVMQQFYMERSKAFLEKSERQVQMFWSPTYASDTSLDFMDQVVLIAV